MNINKYLAFLKTVEYGSFTRAAEYLNYSQSGISRMIRDLENEWNVTLLDRDRGGVRLTSDGVRLLPFIRRAYDECAKLEMEVESMNSLGSGLIRLGTFSSVATHWLPDIIARFGSDYPNIDFELHQCDYTETERGIADGILDCGFTLLPAREDLDTIYIANDKLKVLLPMDHPLAGEERISLNALEEYPFILSKSGNDSEVEAFLRVNDVHPSVKFSTWDDNIIFAMVERGLGISMLSELVLTRCPFTIAIRDLEVPASRDIGFALQDRRTASLAVRKFMEYLTELPLQA